MTTRPYELLARFGQDGSIAGVSVRTITTVNGRDYESDPSPLSGATDPAFVAFAESFSAAAIAERDESVEIIAARDATIATLQAAADQHADLLAAKDARIVELEEQLDAILHPANPFPDADWGQFKLRILADPAVQLVAEGNPTAWPLMVLYLSQLDTNPSRGADIAQLWTIMEGHVPITEEDVQRVNAIASDCGIPLQMNIDGSIG